MLAKNLWRERRGFPCDCVYQSTTLADTHASVVFASFDKWFKIKCVGYAHRGWKSLEEEKTREIERTSKMRWILWKGSSVSLSVCICVSFALSFCLSSCLSFSVHRAASVLWGVVIWVNSDTSSTCFALLSRKVTCIVSMSEKDRLFSHLDALSWRTAGERRRRRKWSRSM